MFYRDKLVLVTGGTGFVGTHFVRQLLAAGARVRVPVHERKLHINHPAIEPVAADLTRAADCRALAQGVRYVVHAAGAVAGAGGGPAGAMAGIALNLTLTANMLEAAWSEGVERFLLFSSSAAYPVADYPITEEEMWSGPTHASYFGYGWMRRYLERLAEFVASRSQLRIAIVRPTAVYGPGDNFDPATSHVIAALIRKAVKKLTPYEVWGTGDEIRDCLHISDLVRGCLLLLEKHAACDPVNIGYGQAITVKEMVRIILKCTGHEEALVRFDASRPGTIPVRMVATGKAERLLGFKPAISFEAGIQDTVNWYQQHRAGSPA